MNIKHFKEAFEKEEKLRKETEENNARLIKDKNDMYYNWKPNVQIHAGAEERLTKLITQKADLEQQIKDMEERINEEEESNIRIK
jgi:hypothetical protein